MTTKNNTDSSQQNQQGSSAQNDSLHQLTQNTSNDERDARIKNEPDTRRLRSERQSVIDGEQDNKQE